MIIKRSISPNGKLMTADVKTGLSSRVGFMTQWRVYRRDVDSLESWIGISQTRLGRGQAHTHTHTHTQTHTHMAPCSAAVP